MSILSEYLWIVIVAGICCFGMGFGMGANDVANNFGPSVGAGSVSIKQTLIIAAIFEIVGATAFGASVTDAVRKGVYDVDVFGEEPDVFFMSNLCVLISTTIWLFTASSTGLSVSTTHSLIGSMMGTGLAVAFNSIHWGYIGTILIGWVAAPIIGAALGGGLYVCIKKFILRKENPLRRAFIFYPFMLFYIGFCLFFFFVFKSPLRLPFECEIPNADYDESMDPSLEMTPTRPCPISPWFSHHVSIGWGAVCAGAVVFLVVTYIPVKMIIERRIKAMYKLPSDVSDVTEGDATSEKSISPATGCWAKIRHHAPWNKSMEASGKHSQQMDSFKMMAEEFDGEVLKFFGGFQLVSASLACLVHGANDVSNAAAPFATIISMYQLGEFSSHVDVPIWILVMGGLSIAVGLTILGYKVLRTMSVELVHLDAAKAFSAEISLFTVMIFASYIGLPLSSTHSSVGAMIGVGLASTHWNYETEEITTVNDDGTTSVEIRKLVNGNKNRIDNKLFGLLNMNAVNWKTCKRLAYGWIYTLIFTCALGYLIFSFAIKSPTTVSRYFICADGQWVDGVCTGLLSEM